MKKIKMLFSLILILAGSQLLLAQTGNRIDSLKLYPSAPTSQDSVWVIVYTTFMSGECMLNHYNLTIDKEIIQISANYKVGDYQAICDSQDTLFLGNLPSNYYRLFTSLTIDTIHPVFDTDSLNFEIGTTGISDIKDYNQNINLYPNPTQDKIIVDTHLTIEKVSIKNQEGKEVYSATLNHLNSLNISSLPKGIYFLELEVEGEVLKKKIVKE